MQLFIKDTFDNKFSYEDIKKKSIVSNLDTEEAWINIIVPFRNRSNFINPLIESFESAIKYYNEVSDKTKKIIITFVEHDYTPKNQELLINKVNYIWTPGNISDQFSRSFCFNFGVKYSPKANYYLLHDLDLLVKQDFFVRLFKNIKNYKCIQPYCNRHVLYMSESLTKKIISKEISVNSLFNGYPEVTPPEHKGSKGGSTLIEREMFFRVGGFDPDLFWGYAPEDQLFWEKVSAITEIGYADDPPVEIFHMWHELMLRHNPLHGKMEWYMQEYRNLDNISKLNYIDLKRKFFNE